MQITKYVQYFHSKIQSNKIPCYAVAYTYLLNIQHNKPLKYDLIKKRFY